MTYLTPMERSILDTLIRADQPLTEKQIYAEATGAQPVDTTQIRTHLCNLRQKGCQILNTANYGYWLEEKTEVTRMVKEEKRRRKRGHGRRRAGLIPPKEFFAALDKAYAQMSKR